MPFTILPYNVTGGVNDSNVDMTAAVDTEFSRRNNHYIFTRQFNLIGAFINGANMTRVRFNVPSWNAIGRQQIYPPHRSATVPSNPVLHDLRNNPVPIPQNEEIALEESNNLGAATEQENCALLIASPDWQMAGQAQGQLFDLRFTASVTGVAQAWSAPVAITMADNLKGGWYSVLGAQVQAAAFLYFRFRPIRFAGYQGIKMLPGGLCQQALGDIPARWQDYRPADNMGEWLRFHSFELPLIEGWANSAGAVTVEGRMLCSYLGDRGGYQ